MDAAVRLQGLVPTPADGILTPSDELSSLSAARRPPLPDVTIENPILNSPYREPDRHWKFGDEGITRDTADGRRVSSYFMPIAPAKKKGAQIDFQTEWTLDRIRENVEINRIRQRVGIWRQGGYAGI